MNSSKPEKTKAIDSLEIDYDHIDVAALVTQIQKAAAEAPPVEARETVAPRDSTSLPSPSPRDSTPPPPASPSGLGPPDSTASLPRPAPTAPRVTTSPTSGPQDSISPPLPLPPIPPSPSPLSTEPVSGPQGLKQKIKKILRKLIKPFFPVIRLLAFPIHEELRTTIESLHETNMRLDYLFQLLHFQEEKYDRRLESVDQRIYRNELRLDTLEERHGDLEQKFDQRLEIVDQRIEKSEQRLDRSEGALDERLKDLDKSMDYIRLLYNLDHNLVVELTKLKIEADTLKSKFRILEKDQEFLQKREKAFEERSAK
jgi:hypothetical protein